MNEAKLNFCQGMSEAFRAAWFDISCILELPEEDIDLRVWLTTYKNQMHNLMNEWLDKAIEALNEEE